MSNKVPASPKVAPYFVHKRSISQSSDDVGGVLSEAEPEGIPGYLVSTPSETNMLVVGIGSDNEVVDMLPSGANADEFGPRTVMVSSFWRWPLCGCGTRSIVKRVCALYFYSANCISLSSSVPAPPFSYIQQAIAETDELSKDASATRDEDTNYTGPDAPVGSLLLRRQVPVKVDPKTYFANERTLLLWLHSALWLFAGASTIVKYSNDDPFAQIYGIILLPVALAFTTYAIWQRKCRSSPVTKHVTGVACVFHRHVTIDCFGLVSSNKPIEFNSISFVISIDHHYFLHNTDARRVKMIRVKHPGPYEDLLGPALLGVALMTAIVAQFSLKLYSVWYY